MSNTDVPHWLMPDEQKAVIATLVKYGIIKWDNRRQMPLKKGGTTDVYINLRDMRSHPRVIHFLAEAYKYPLRRFFVDRIVEVPEAVSSLAGHLSVITGIPLVTIREEAKEGRVTKGRLVGDIKHGDRVAIIDDVITDGRSKESALAELHAIGAEVVAIIVLVDRQQGWKEKLAAMGWEDVLVWSGMTLHDVRAYLVRHGLMERCDPLIEEKNQLIIALDGKPWEEVLPLVDRLRPSGCILKANDLLDEAGINEMITRLSVYGRVMVDKKLHDIPNTVANYCKRIARTPPWAITVHASGGRKMIEAAVKAFEGTEVMVLAVTVLTSIDEETCEEIFVRQPIEEVKVLAAIASEAGAHGFVCSPEEVATLRSTYPDKALVVPGCRSPGKDRGDQQRVATFVETKETGADFFVGGRQFLEATDPVSEIRRVTTEELGIDT